MCSQTSGPIYMNIWLDKTKNRNIMYSSNFLSLKKQCIFYIVHVSKQMHIYKI